MKHRLIILGISLLASITANAQNIQEYDAHPSNWEWDVEASANSSYYWAGQMYGGLSLYPSAFASYCFTDDFSLDLGLEAYVDTGLLFPLSDSEAYNCSTASIGCTYKGLSAYIDYEIYDWAFGDISSHYLAAGFDWTVCESFPLSVSWYSVLYNKCLYDEDNELYGEIINGKQAHSTVITVGYPFYIGENLSITPNVEVVPWNSPFCGYEKFSVCGLYANASYEFPIGEHSLPLNIMAGWNPALNQFIYSAGLTFCL